MISDVGKYSAYNFEKIVAIVTILTKSLHCGYSEAQVKKHSLCTSKHFTNNVECEKMFRKINNVDI